MTAEQPPRRWQWVRLSGGWLNLATVTELEEVGDGMLQANFINRVSDPQGRPDHGSTVYVDEDAELLRAHMDTICPPLDD